MTSERAKTPYIIGIAGGSGIRKIHDRSKHFGRPAFWAGLLLEQDHYYRSQGNLPQNEREKVNYDHPDALEMELFIAHLDALRRGDRIARPTYDFARHDRAPDATWLAPAAVIVVEGILVLADERLRARFDVKIFVDTDADIRLMRRIRRDLEQRGRTFAQVRKQYYETVRPMHLAFVEPSKRFADVIVPEGGENRVAVDFLRSHIRGRV